MENKWKKTFVDKTQVEFIMYYIAGEARLLKMFYTTAKHYVRGLYLKGVGEWHKVEVTLIPVYEEPGEKGVVDGSDLNKANDFCEGLILVALQEYGQI